jgi:hypothetical protein
VSQVIHAAFLASDLVEALLRDAACAVHRASVMKELPWDWSEQRRRFKLMLGINDSLGVRD